ncbi:hypothetical protein L249_7789 [Ophiocordyceps polyrhachis-furcata BCC 54312]|uniref:PhoD-like phosphatase domain-containing protein n=1 Tax=Ophiocordyceps polyrhachis-furcata BCC 54312 TaxID=1330021 RepID=A0A367L0N9_9HYPO|nr:hypothetical protein L249_7789 [Ophiocordyceps polyrhachis-furcata BCC 54312]
MAAPYWGQLPEPSVAGQRTGQPRPADDVAAAPDSFIGGVASSTERDAKHHHHNHHNQHQHQPQPAAIRPQRMLANDRSPLQRLELTLDSLTKEEKRARVEAAEQRARQRAALRASNQEHNQLSSSPPPPPPLAPGNEDKSERVVVRGEEETDPPPPVRQTSRKLTKAQPQPSLPLSSRNKQLPPIPSLPPEKRPLEADLVDKQRILEASGPVFNGKQRPAEAPAPVLNEKKQQPPARWMDDWKKATTGTLSGPLLDLANDAVVDNRNKAWWEAPPKRPPPPPVFDDDADVPTRFKPPLYLQCGPLLRYCGLRRETLLTRHHGDAIQREIWRGSVMIVTKDTESSYEIAPSLRLFVQNVQLLPPPPQQVDGELPPEYVDPIAGHTKLGRRGETLYVRPVEHVDEARDLSCVERGGLFESTRSPPADGSPADGSRILADGERMQKYKDVRGFRLHTERGCTFWRFNIEVELRERQQRIAYRINRGPPAAFWVPARGQTMNMVFYSGNGFGPDVRPDDLSGPDPLWRDVLNTHQTQPFHVMIGGGNQIYNDGIAEESDLVANWLYTRGADDTVFSAEMQHELESLYLGRYSLGFSQGLYGLATSQIPMVNMYDDHDVLGACGSLPHHLLSGPVFAGIGAVAFKYYMLFQHQSLPTETESSEPSWILGLHPGSYMHELSRSVFVSLGGKTALLAVDCRTERTESTVVRETTWEKMTNRLYAELRRGHMDHLLVLSALPVAFARPENSFTSMLMSPVKTLGRRASMDKMADGGYWVTRAHKRERGIIVEDLQDLAIDKSMRITVLSGNVNLAAAGQFSSNPRLSLAKHRDPRYIPNIITSAVADAPATHKVAEMFGRRVKVHRFDKQTDEGMIPLFRHGVDGRRRSNAHFMPRRSWCSIRQWVPGYTPPPTPPSSGHGTSPSTGVFRRLSSKASRFDAVGRQTDSRPPVSGGGLGLFRSLSRRRSTGAHQPTKLRRTMSLGTKDRGYLSTGWRTDDGRRADRDDGYAALARPAPGPGDEFAAGDESLFTATRRAQPTSNPPQRPFHRTPTGLSAKQRLQADRYAVDLEGGLEVTINVEASARDPAGITVPYRLLIPRLQYEYDPAEDDLAPASPEPGGLRKLLSLRRGRPKPVNDDDHKDDDDDDDDGLSEAEGDGYSRR